MRLCIQCIDSLCHCHPGSLPPPVLKAQHSICGNPVVEGGKSEAAQETQLDLGIGGRGQQAMERKLHPYYHQVRPPPPNTSQTPHIFFLEDIIIMHSHFVIIIYRAAVHLSIL